jgi:SnoaL-like protein
MDRKETGMEQAAPLESTVNHGGIKMAKAKISKTNDAVAVVRAAYEAYVTKDRAAIERLIADDFHFTSPLDNRIDRETYFARCWPNSDWIKGFDYINLVPDGKRVFVTYEGHSTKGNRFRNTEILSVDNGQIVEVEVYFGWSIPHKAKPGGFVPDDVLK